jgi:hypothetical protein
MNRWILVFVLASASAPVTAQDNVAERGAKKAGNALERSGKAIERGAKRTAKAAERPRSATQKFLEKSGKKIDEATSGK